MEWSNYPHSLFKHRAAFCCQWKQRYLKPLCLHWNSSVDFTFKSMRKEVVQKRVTWLVQVCNHANVCIVSRSERGMDECKACGVWISSVLWCDVHVLQVDGWFSLAPSLTCTLCLPAPECTLCRTAACHCLNIECFFFLVFSSGKEKIWIKVAVHFWLDKYVI